MDCIQSEAVHPRCQSADLKMKLVEFVDTDVVRATVTKHASQNEKK